ncbi:MAG: eS25 family ribosomal protein [Candidatus Jordarchaeum sp.]|uniref:eS25 family ribosomal protein n=1 Tax=Candidatus Jordarchaeum sp. TaxID=2823881 RepID=UPI00404B4766
MSKKKWTKEPKVVEKEIRNILIDDELKSTIEEEIPKMKMITPTAISGKYNIRISIAKEIISNLENKGKIKLVESNRRIKVYTPTEKTKKKEK